MPKKILVINQLVSFLFIDILNECVDVFDEVTLLTGKVVPMETPLDSRVKVHPVYKYNRTTTFSRFRSWVIGFIQCLYLVLVKYRGHYLLISSNPPTATLLPLFIKNRSSMLIYDLYPEGIVAGGFVTERNWIFRVWKKLNKKSYEKVDYIFTITKGMAGVLEQYSTKNNVILNPLWATNFSERTFKPGVTNLFIEKYDLHGKFIVLYSGNLGKEYEVEAIIDIADNLKGNEKVQFVIAGRGWRKQQLEELIKEKNLPNVLMIPFQDAEMFQHSMVAMHIGVVAQSVNASQVCIPSKVYNIMAFAKPVICIGSRDNDLGELIVENDLGIVCGADNIAGMVSFIENLSHNRQLYDQYCAKVKKASVDYTSDNAKALVSMIADTV